MFSRLYRRSHISVTRRLIAKYSTHINWRPLSKPDANAEYVIKDYDLAQIAMAKEIRLRAAKRQKLIAGDQSNHLREGTNEEILAFESLELLARDRPETSGDVKETATKSSNGSTSEWGEEVEVEIEELSSTGDGLARSQDNTLVYVVPFTVPGDRVLTRVPSKFRPRSWVPADFVELIRPSPKRDGVTPGCKYFGSCSGCQLQMLPYEQQLEHKRTIVQKAYRHFSDLDPKQIPEIGSTMPSPLQYGYRTKLTPHFDGPPRRKGQRFFTEVPAIGFTKKNWRKVMDIESCPIGTDIVQEGLKVERAKVIANIHKYKNGATILLRETTNRTVTNDSNIDNNTTTAADSEPISQDPSLKDQPPKTTTTPSHEQPTSTSLEYDTTTGRPTQTLTYPTHTDRKTYTSNNEDLTTEYISPNYTFTSRAGSFFQNNNSILSSFIAYIKSHALPSPSTSTSDTPSSPPRPIKYLLDAYCGSGLFAITLSPLFTGVLGIDIDGKAIIAARQNATLNSISNAGFLEADASDLFADVPFPSDQSLVVIDPPRKGASEDFLRQLTRFGPRRVVYVSCNVHTQARDVGMLVRGFGNEGGEERNRKGGGGGWRYEIESLRGCDFFPQTGHVEGVCILNRVSDSVV